MRSVSPHIHRRRKSTVTKLKEARTPLSSGAFGLLPFPGIQLYAKKRGFRPLQKKRNPLLFTKSKAFEKSN